VAVMNSLRKHAKWVDRVRCSRHSGGCSVLLTPLKERYYHC